MGKRRRKRRTHVAAELDSVPKTFVFNRTKLGLSATQLMLDLRHCMEPFTASNLKARRQNVLKDFVNVAGPLGITHLLMFSRTELAVNLRIGRLPRGPTLTFRVDHFCLARDVVRAQKRPQTTLLQFRTPPLLVLNGFPKDSNAMKLATRVFQNMFPSIDVETVKLVEIRRVVLIHYNAESEKFEFRHYNISVRPVGMSRNVKRLIKSEIPDLSKLDDIADYILQEASGNDSDAEMLGDSKVVLPQKMSGAGNKESSQSAVKLTELGPRMTMTLLKIEEGLCEGAVLHHKYIKKTPEEIKQMEAAREKRAMLKAQRRKLQAANIERKQKQREAHKQRSMDGQKRKAYLMRQMAKEASEPLAEDDDAQYYREEVGEDAPEDEFLGTSSRRGGSHKRKMSARDRVEDADAGDFGAAGNAHATGQTAAKRVKPNQGGRPASTTSRTQAKSKPANRGKGKGAGLESKVKAKFKAAVKGGRPGAKPRGHKKRQ